MKIHVDLIFEPRDLWIGIYISKLHKVGPLRSRSIYILPVPCIGIVITFNWSLV